MSGTGAERQRRYRAHKAGDHSLCDPDRCSPQTVTVTAAVTRDTVTPAGVSLGSRGRRLWRQVADDGPDLKPAERVLLEEACRIADRLDRLDAILSGESAEWMRLQVSDDGPEVTVGIDRVLSEARQQQVALKQLLGELRQSRAASAPAVQRRPSPTGGTDKGGAGVVDLAARIAQRSNRTAG